MSLNRDLSAERAAGGIVARSGDVATMGNGARWWLNGSQWARDETDAAIARTHRQMIPHRR